MLGSGAQMMSIMELPSFYSSDFSSIRYYFLAGNRMPADLPAKACRYFPNADLINCLGMTELCGFYTVAMLNSGCEPTSVGQLSHNVTVKIVDERGSLCGVDVDGELYLKRVYNVLEYYGNPTATAKLFDSDGFMKSGDIGHFDKNGNLHLVDRKVDMLGYCDHQIAPSKIENVVIKSPDIEAVCVIGISDNVSGDLPAAAVIRKTDSKITTDEILAMVAGE